MAKKTNFEDKGKKVDKIPVEINYRIIELFSAGLYSSPNKAFEELVSNSYDADANHVAVFIQDDLDSENSFIWVCDNGTSMDSSGLKKLWRIGETDKRTNKYSGKRKPIGQFGIGKLATYVLADKLTHICKNNEEYRIVTMDYTKVTPNGGISTKKIYLDERILTEDQVKEILDPLINFKDTKMIPFELWGNKAEKNWTIAIMSDLKDKGKSIKKGPLKWILSTALPVHPNFKLSFNGENLEPSKVSGKIIKEWVLGKNDEIVEREKYTSREADGEYYVDLPHLKNIQGKLTLYEDTLTGKKSDKLGRSHGIFLTIRGRLLNTNNALLNGLDELHHATFNRIRFEIHADDLDELLTSGRESIKDYTEYGELLTYIKQKFFKAKASFDDWCEKRYPPENFADRISNVSPFYSKIPIYEAVRKCLKEEISCPLMIKFPSEMSNDDKDKILRDLDESIPDPKKTIIDDYSLDNDLKLDDPIAKLNLIEKKIEVNVHHPFYLTFLSEMKGKSNLPFTLIAANEIFTEASLIEKNVDQVNIQDIMRRRDQMLREFSNQGKPDIFRAVIMLKNSLDDSKGLEEALHVCFDCLGFEVTPLAKKGTAEGKAIARLGVWDDKNQDYSFTYEAKSTKKDKIKADTTKTGVVNIHREKHEADYALEVAIDYEGAEDPESNVSKLAENDNVTLIRAKDLWKLMINAIPKLNFLKFKEFLDKCKTVSQSSDWVEQFCNEDVERKPYSEILTSIWSIMKEDPQESPTLESIRFQDAQLKKYKIEDLKEMINTLQMMMPYSINLEGNKIRILLPPEKILESLNDVIEKQTVPEFKKKLSEAFINNLNKF